MVGQVAKSTDEDDHWRQLEVMNLVPGKTYEFRLKAQSIFGIGAASKISRCAQCEYEICPWTFCLSSNKKTT